MPVEALAENLLLIVGLARAEILRRSEMRERAFELDVAAIGQRAAKASISDGEIPGGSCPC